MASLVLQLQEAVLNKNTKLVDLLRLALVVARKLDIADFEKWLGNELDGYKKRADLPEYRILRGASRAFNMYHGWQDIGFKEAKPAEVFSTGPVFDPIAVVEELTLGAQNELIMSYPPDVAHNLLKQAGYGWSRPSIHFSAAQFSGILDAVRNGVLDWSLKLEKSGVLGEGMTFSNDERQRAQSASTLPVYSATHMTVIQSMTQSQVQQGSPGATQTFTLKTVDVKDLLDFVKGVRAIEAQLPEQDQKQANADLATLEAQAAAPTPSPGIVMEAVSSVRKILESAAGSLTASTLPGLLQKAASLLS